MTRTPPPAEPFIEPSETHESYEPTKPHILLPPQTSSSISTSLQSEPEFLSLSSLEIQNSSSGTPSLQHQSNSLELPTNESPPDLINNAASYPSLSDRNSPAYNRSLSNLSTNYKSDPINIRGNESEIDYNNVLDDDDSPPNSDSVLLRQQTRSPAQKLTLRRQNSYKDVPTNNNGFSNPGGGGGGLRHSSSEVNINRSSHQRNGKSLINNVPNTRKEISSRLSNNRISTSNSRIPNLNSQNTAHNRIKSSSAATNHPAPVDIYVTSKNNRNSVNYSKQVDGMEEKQLERRRTDFVPMPVDKPVGLDFNDFLPVSKFFIF